MAIQGVLHGLRTRGTFDVEVRLDGEWVKFNQLINTMNLTMGVAALEIQKKFAEKYAENVRKNIRNGGKKFGYPPHTSYYSAWKAAHGGPGRLLYWDGTMANSVQVKKVSGGRWGAGIPKEIKRERYFDKEGGILEVSEYANILEHGAYSRGVVARPVFADTFKEMGGLKGMKTFFQFHLVRNFNKKGIMLSKI